jgi:hypothetical protein
VIPIIFGAKFTARQSHAQNYQKNAALPIIEIAGLGFRTKGRNAIEEDEGYQLCEPPASYKLFLRLKKGYRP